MINILWFSLCPPYKEVRHAGGQALYKHVVAFLKDKDIKLQMVSLCSKEELQYVKNLSDNYSIELIMEEKSKNLIIDYESRWNPLHRFGGYLSNSRYHKLSKVIQKLKKQEYEPDVIILNWTEMLALEKTLKSIYPKTPMVAIEEDVAYVKRKRRIDNASNNVAKIFHQIRYKNCVNKEKNWLEDMNMVSVYSNKDRERLTKIGIDNKKIFTFSPVFSDKSKLKWKKKNNDIIFWGAMSRKENSDSAIWFIDMVMPLLKDIDCRFVVVGANPPNELLEKQSNRIIVTGFVDDPDVYFCDSACMVVPLVIGAGIKIKVLEGLSSGIPIISNNIGIEGIDVVNGLNYLHAETAQEFANAITKIMNDKELSDAISEKAKYMIRKNYNEKASTDKFIELCKDLVQ